MYGNHGTSAGSGAPRCEGCGRAYPVDDLYAVRLPNGDTTACCSDCKEYAEAAAAKSGDIDQARVACDGCGDEFPVDDLSEVTLFNGSTVRCCRDCVEHAPRADAGGARARAAASGGASGGADTTGGSESGGDARERRHAGTDDADGSATAAATGEKNMCGQCRELFSVELYEVETVDGRTERFCEECKEEGKDEGIVKNVRMRRAEAYRILGVAGSADEETLTEAYHDLVREVHPDRENGSRARFKRVQRAYDRLVED